MKKYFTIYLTLLFLTTFNTSVNAQVKQLDKCPNSRAYITDISSLSLAAKGDFSPPTTASLFDIQFTLMLDSVVSASSGFAALAWTGTEWWVAKWNKDSLFTLSPTGTVTASFKIPGVGAPASGVRSITYDGAFLYMADNTTIIKKVNPATKTLVSTIDASAVGFNSRSITYNAATNGGAGGFWISNFGTAIIEMDITGTVLNSISLATHTLSGIYGLAMDTLSPGGPFLWAFNQGNGGAGSFLARLNLPIGNLGFINHNVNSDVGLLTPTIGIAGGVFITDSYVPGKFTIAGVMQDTASDVLFAYELDSTSQLAYDAAIDTFKWLPSYTILPDHQVSAFTFPAKVSNLGAGVIPSVVYNVDVNLLGSSVYTGSGTISNVQPGVSTLISPVGSYLPTAIGNYLVSGSLTMLGQTDQNPSNDTSSFSFAISDTVMARDNGVINGAVGIGNSVTGTLGQIFNFTTNDQITSVTFSCNGPTAGDTTRVNIYSFTGTSPGTVLGRSDYYIFTAADTNGVLLTLEVKNLAGNPMAVNAGVYYVGIEEHMDNVSLATSTFNWRPNVTFISFPGQAWAPNENFGFKRIFAMRVNTGNSVVSLDEFSSSSKINIFPNPANDRISLTFEDGFTAYSVFDLQGKRVGGQDFGKIQLQTEIFINDFNSGMYFLMISDGNKNRYQKKFVKL